MFLPISHQCDTVACWCQLQALCADSRILSLSLLQVAYYGSPIEAPGLFLKAYQVSRLEGEAPILDRSNNPADVIMDMLGSSNYRTAILNYYKTTVEPKAVKNAIKLANRDEGGQGFEDK